jgi:hypothetical protein
MNERRCACPDPDPVRCYDLRYYGYTPVLRGRPYGEAYYVAQETLTAAELDDGECRCPCHQEVEDEDADEV